MNKKLAFALSLAAAVTLTIVGCASGKSSQGASTDALPTPATPPPGAPAPATAASKASTAPQTASEEIHNPAAPAAPVATETYVVKSGDSLWKIARERKTSVAKIKDLNHLTSDVIKAGDELVVPVLK